MALSKKKKKLLTGLLIGIVTCVFISFITNYYAIDFFDGLENVAYDYRYNFKYIIGKSKERKKDPIESVVIVDIDERSFSKLGLYHKWPRSYHGEVVKTLAHGGASSIIFDIMFKTADFGASQAQEIMKILKKSDDNTNWDQYQSSIKKGLNYDASLVQQVANSDQTITAALMNEDEVYPNKSDWMWMATEDRHKKVHPKSSADLDPKIIEHFETKPILDNIFEELAHASTRIGMVNVVADPDGPHRSLPLFYNFPSLEITKTNVQHTYPVLALQSSLFMMGKTLDDIEIIPGEYVNLGSPLRVFRKDGVLQTSYPKFTIPMLSQFFIKKKEILALGPENPSTLIVSNPIMVRKDFDDNIEIEVLEGGFIEQEMVEALIQHKPTMESIQKATEDEPYMLTESIGFYPGEEDDEDRYLLLNSESEEEVLLDNFTITTIRDNWPTDRIQTLQPGKSLTVSGYLPLRFDIQREEIISPIVVLTKKLITSLYTHRIDDITALKEGESIAIGDEIKIPIDDKGRMLINYMGEGGANLTFRYMSYYDVMAGRLDPTDFQGKAFILGSSATALFDIVSSTFDESYPGVEIHATAIYNILTNQFMTRLKKHQTLLIMIFIGVITGLLAYFLPLLWSIFIIIIMAGGYGILSFYLFHNMIWIEFARPEITLFTTFLAVMIARYLFEERDKKFLNDAFKNYISPELIDMMIESGDRPSLGGSEAELTAYFTDIQSFSTFSEKLGSPTKLVELLNEYLSEMTDLLVANMGTLDKYEGDAIIAFFGAPVHMPDHQAAACRTALLMQDKLNDLRKKWKSEGDKWPDIVHNMRMRIGLNSGPIVTGNMGSKMRMNYTMMGDAVNLSARLESGAKQYGVFSMASKETLVGAGDDIFSRELDLIRVVGKSEPVRIYELLSFTNKLTPEIEKCKQLYEEGLSLYRAQKWEEATKVFTECQRFEPNHPNIALGCKTTPSHVFIERCYRFQTDRRMGLSSDWDGVFTATEK
ncbi:MAG: CHASE2 domain-containing protein [Fibrobacteria bacterium]|nr:CHASE2 domain-containing protein [Fibrobacteria bacterium]